MTYLATSKLNKLTLNLKPAAYSKTGKTKHWEIVECYKKKKNKTKLTHLLAKQVIWMTQDSMKEYHHT